MSVLTLAKLASGCTDGHCVIRGRARGLHTNGGCRCRRAVMRHEVAGLRWCTEHVLGRDGHPVRSDYVIVANYPNEERSVRNVGDLWDGVRAVARRAVQIDEELRGG